MKVIDITNDKEALYRLGENERVVFLMENRDGEIIFELAGSGSAAHVFALYNGTEGNRFTPRIIQRHLAPGTVSSSTVRARLDGSSSLRFRGLVEIDRGATRSDARQNIRVLLLSPDSSASAVPELEIDTDEVSCTHAAAIAPPDVEQLSYLATRGISPDQATALIAEGFFKDTLEKIEILRHMQ
ncbi:MAG: SufD family Fe-S cluster assembly protein [Candidatus Moranbacteria bacterium]|nr:SufD family Fe-S cluster assembly protein [Candidatus Moranbacteria bacterium]